jgi:hypothetical protein
MHVRLKLGPKRGSSGLGLGVVGANHADIGSQLRQHEPEWVQAFVARKVRECIMVTQELKKIDACSFVRVTDINELLGVTWLQEKHPHLPSGEAFATNEQLLHDLRQPKEALPPNFHFLQDLQLALCIVHVAPFGDRARHVSVAFVAAMPSGSMQWAPGNHTYICTDQDDMHRAAGKIAYYVSRANGTEKVLPYDAWRMANPLVFLAFESMDRSDDEHARVIDALEACQLACQ